MKTFELCCHIWIIFLIVLVALGVSAITILIVVTQQIQHNMQEAFYDTNKVLSEHVQDRARVLVDTNASMSNVAKILSTHLDTNDSPFSLLDSKVPPTLFMMHTTLSRVSQISYVSKKGLLFSYYYDKNQLFAMFSNGSVTSNDSTSYNWCSQLVNETSGERYGFVTTVPSKQLNESQWFQDALTGKSGYTSWGFSWGADKDQMLFLTIPVANIGVVSVGIKVKDFTDYVFDIDLHGAYLYLSSIDGNLFAQHGPSNIQYILNGSIVSIHKVGENEIISGERYANVLCDVDEEGLLSSKYIDISGEKYLFSCDSFDVVGMKLVTVTSFPPRRIIHIFEHMKIIVILLISILVLAMLFGNCCTLQLFRRSQVQEALLQSNIIKLKDAIQQAERKSMNKSLAFASASHDVRTSLAGISGLIELCRCNVPPQSELEMNLVQMNDCASKLLGIINSVLDMSKVEAGKMQLDEVEFDMAQVLEESVDIFHVVALKKPLEVIWDPCDFSVLSTLNVKGDCRRFRQILDNLLGNAVKFTSSGHVVLRAWAKKPSYESFKHSPSRDFQISNIYRAFIGWFCKDENLITLNTVQKNDPNLIEFIFEVDDTGTGIPKEKRASVFENYVQVVGGPQGSEGTGLGLGIVQSFVRLMGGEINIRDKEHSERGACFRFNIFLKSCEIVSSGTEENKDSPNQLHQISHREEFSVHSSTRAMTFRKALKVDGVQSLLLVEGDETRRILRKWMENIGMKVWIVQQWDLLQSMLEKINKHADSGSGKFGSTFYMRSLSKNRSLDANMEKNLSHSLDDATDQILPPSARDVYKKRSKDSSVRVLIFIDYRCADFSNICSVLNNFSTWNERIHIKVIWLVDANNQSADLRSGNQKLCDLVLKKPIHGSRLYEILKLLQNFEEKNEGYSSKIKSEDILHDSLQSEESNSLAKNNNQVSQNSVVPQSVETANKLDNDKPISGMRILLVEDTLLMRRIASAALSRLGATVESVENGLEAVNLIKNVLKEAYGAKLPYDAILMDCEMPVMNGYEATRNIRAEEKFYGVRIPIIALTAHAAVEEEKKATLSGMDFTFTKPIDAKLISEALRSVCQH